MYKRINKLFGTRYTSNWEIDWNRIVRNYSLKEDFIEEFKDKLDWGLISIYQSLSESFIEKYKNRISWGNICIYQNLSEEFIEKYSRKYLIVDWDLISTYQTLSEEFIEKHENQVTWGLISKYQNLSEAFIEKHKNLISWKDISGHQVLSESFIEKYKDLVNWHELILNQPFLNANKLCGSDRAMCKEANTFYKLYQETKEQGWFLSYININKDTQKVYKLIMNNITADDPRNLTRIRIYWKNLKNLYLIRKEDLEIIRKIKFV